MISYRQADLFKRLKEIRMTPRQVKFENRGDGYVMPVKGQEIEDIFKKAMESAGFIMNRATAEYFYVYEPYNEYKARIVDAFDYICEYLERNGFLNSTWSSVKIERLGGTATVEYRK